MSPLVLSLLLAAGVRAGADSLTAPGISRELATYRASRVHDVRYALDLDLTARDTARGHVAIRFRRTGTGDAIVDFRGLALGTAVVNGRVAEGVAANGAHVRVPARLLVAGYNTLDLDFAAAIAPAGASIIRFHDSGDGADYLYTLLVPADANALFPCFDQPDLKARVSLALKVPARWTAVGNGAVRDSALTDSTKLFRFAQSEPISTYLIAFAAGPWKTVTRSVGGRAITMYARASRIAEAESDSLIESNARALAWLERYFGTPFPFGKFDFVLAPAFPFGGMEHPGAVFYNEESFIYRERPTLTQRLGRTATIYHEVAHQWFGDYVTMTWFDDLWLKEGFATYMAAKMQDALDPASQAWKTFYLRNKPAAYGVDVTEGTTPVWQALANLDQAKSNYGAIVYNKAPGVLKQLNYLVGDSAFQAGLRRYLRAHAYGNATWRDLLGAIGTAARRDLQPWGRQYILRRGAPVLEATAARVDTDASGGRLRSVRVSQRGAQRAFGAAPWPIRTQLLVWGADAGAPGATLPVELRGATTVASLPTAVAEPALIFPNAGDYAYAVTLLDGTSTRWVERRIGGVTDPFLRAMLWGALWDLVREARYSPASYVRLAGAEMQRERDEQIVSSVLARVARTANRYLDMAQRDTLLPALEQQLLAVVADTTRAYGLRKSHLDALVAVAGTRPTLERLAGLLDGDSLPGLPVRAPTRWAIVTTLVARGMPGAEQRIDAELERDSTSEGRRRAFVAGAARPADSSKAEYFRRYFADSTLNEDWATASLGAFNAPGHERLTIRFLEPALDSLPWIQRNRRIFYLGSWLDAFTSGQTSAEAVAIVDRYLAANPRLRADLRSKVLQSADELRRTVAIRAAFAGAR
ncbi:MAG TPA: M1 family aminopeptidase [Gemmatimonadaceae bacterium]|nr:M1 family aminopeptidase [Gemmatimonadaceae bacterium]